MYFKDVQNGRIVISTTVDDFLVTGPDDKSIQEFKKILATKY